MIPTISRFQLYISILLLLLFPKNMQAQQERFRFVQLTDIHFSPGNPNPTEDLLRSVAQINATDSIDFVLVTGDLTDNGDRTCMEHVKSCLDLLKVPYHVILGNHETKWSESGCTAFSEIYGNERFSFMHKGFLFLGFNSGPLMRMAYGHVVPQDIEWMTAEIEKADKDTPIILVTHYPMLEGDVDNWYDVTDAVRPYNVRLFIGGHYHRNRQLSYDGIPGILMRSNLRDSDGKPGYGIYEVGPDSIRVYTQRIGEPQKQWASYSLTHTYYDHQGKAEQYPDYSINQDYPQVKAVWTVQTGVGIYCSPATDGERVFVADDLGNLTAYSLKKDKRLWSFAAEKRIVGTPAVADGVVVFGSADKHIYGVSSMDGKLLWTLKASAPVLGAVAITDGTAYIGASDHTFRAINLKNGKLIWAYTGVKGYIETRPLLADGKVIFGAWDNTLYALDQQTGRECWKWTHGLPGIHYSPAAVWPVAANGKVFIADPKRALTAINLRTGQTVWRTFQSQVRESIGLSEDGQRIYAKTMNDSIVCYAAQKQEASQIWATDAGFGYEHAPCMLPEQDGIVYTSTNDGVVCALDGRTGHLRWQHKVGNSLVNTVVPLKHGSLLVSSTDGTITLLQDKKQK